MEIYCNGVLATAGALTAIYWTPYEWGASKLSFEGTYPDGRIALPVVNYTRILLGYTTVAVRVDKTGSRGPTSHRRETAHV
jgi:hypothetical protein